MFELPWMLAWSVLLVGRSAATSLTYPTVIESGLAVPSNWSLTLNVGVGRFRNDQVSFTSRQYCFNGVCSYPGPTIKIVPGDILTVTLVNDLEPASSTGTMNTMHAPNSTNLHTHGLHIDPAVDTIFTTAEPGGSLVYVYELPADHAPGLHWYHAHRHGSSDMQIMGGLFGALIIAPSGNENLPASLTSESNAHLIILSPLIFEQAVDAATGDVSQGCGNGWACDADWQAPLCTGTESSSPFSPFRVYSYLEISAACGSSLDPESEFVDSDILDMTLVNGHYQPTLDIVADSSTILRILHASGGDELKLELTGGCTINILAWDGVYLDAKIEQSVIPLVPASRVELEVYCVSAGNYVLKGSGVDLLTLVATSSGSTSALVTDNELAAILRPDYLTDLQNSVAQDFYSVHMSQGSRDNSVCGFWFGAGSDCSMVSPWGTEQPSSTNEDCPFSAFQGERGLLPADYTDKYKLVTTLGTVNEWTLYGLGNAKHPLHIHVNHFQVISFEEDGTAESEGTEDYFLPGQWRDTIPAFQGKLTFRFVPQDYTGEHVMHCHFLRHEDLGMMDTFLVVSPSPTETPTLEPSIVPTIAPFESPTAAPSSAPPTVLPSTAVPSLEPTEAPSAAPTSVVPSAVPSLAPSTTPSTTVPSAAPSKAPSMGPTASPAPTTTVDPTPLPTPAPSFRPTLAPTRAPTVLPTAGATSWSVSWQNLLCSATAATLCVFFVF